MRWQDEPVAHIQHACFVQYELLQIIKNDPFASRFQRRIGNEIQGSSHIVEEGDFYPYQDEAEFLFLWIEKNGGLDPNWLKADNGDLLDDNGELYIGSTPERIDGLSQLAALGLNCVVQEFDSIGSETFDSDGFNPHGFSRSEFAFHRSECVLMAYKCLVYTQRLQIGTALTDDESANLKTFDLSKLRKDFATDRAKNAAAAKLANDKTQPEKKRIYKCWVEWQATPGMYPSKAEFARQMIAECDHLKNTKKVEDWCREWGKKHAPS